MVMKQQFLGDFTLLNGGEVYVVAELIFVKSQRRAQSKNRSNKGRCRIPVCAGGGF